MTPAKIDLWGIANEEPKDLELQPLTIDPVSIQPAATPAGFSTLVAALGAEQKLGRGG